MEVISGWPMYFISTQLDVVVESWPWACSSAYLWYSGFSLNSFDVGFEPWDSSLWCTLPITGACMRCDGTINYAATNSSMCCDIWDYVLFNFGVCPLCVGSCCLTRSTGYQNDWIDSRYMQPCNRNFSCGLVMNSLCGSRPFVGAAESWFCQIPIKLVSIV